MWKWYWDVKFHEEPFEEGMEKLWQYYEWKLHTEKYISIKQNDIYELFTPSNLR